MVSWQFNHWMSYATNQCKQPKTWNKKADLTTECPTQTNKAKQPKTWDKKADLTRHPALHVCIALVRVMQTPYKHHGSQASSRPWQLSKPLSNIKTHVQSHLLLSTGTVCYAMPCLTKDSTGYCSAPKLVKKTIAVHSLSVRCRSK